MRDDLAMKTITKLTPSLKELTLILLMFYTSSCRKQDVLSGLDQIAENSHLFEGKRVGLIANHTAVDRSGQTILQIFRDLPDTRVTALFGPEHGFTGQAAAGDSVSHQQIGNIPVFSLYGEINKPTPEMLTNVDVLVYDIMDIGARYYTYISTMGLAMEAAAERKIPFVVLDRPNPIGGSIVQGSWLEKEQFSFVGKYPVPVRHGLTSGELARMIDGQGWLGENRRVELVVIPLVNWSREQFFDDSRSDFIPPSPNIPSLETALLYPGTCLFEGTNISEGRGTDQPFALIGSPWLDSRKVLTDAGSVDGFSLRDTTFTPIPIPGKALYPKWENQVCHGLSVKITDRQLADPFRLAIRLLEIIQKIHPDSLEWRAVHFDRLAGSPEWRKKISTGQSADSLWQKVESTIFQFNSIRAKYLLY